MKEKSSALIHIETSLKEQSDLNQTLSEQCAVMRNEIGMLSSLKTESDSRMAIIEKELESQRFISASLEEKLKSRQIDNNEVSGEKSDVRQEEFDSLKVALISY